MKPTGNPRTSPDPGGPCKRRPDPPQEVPRTPPHPPGVDVTLSVLNSAMPWIVKTEFNDEFVAAPPGAPEETRGGVRLLPCEEDTWAAMASWIAAWEARPDFPRTRPAEEGNEPAVLRLEGSRADALEEAGPYRSSGRDLV